MLFWRSSLRTRPNEIEQAAGLRGGNKVYPYDALINPDVERKLYARCYNAPPQSITGKARPESWRADRTLTFGFL